MGQIGRWIDAMAQHEPDLMREVAAREFGDFSRWIDDTGVCNNADVACGCLVGTAGLAALGVRTWADLRLRSVYCSAACAPRGFLYNPWGFAADALGRRLDVSSLPDSIREMTEKVGLAVTALGEHFGQQRVACLLRARIAAALRVPVEPSPKQMHAAAPV